MQQRSKSKNVKLGKRGLFRKVTQFFFQGWIIVKGIYIENEAELASQVPRTLISKAAKYVSEWRDFAIDKEERFTKPVTKSEGYHWTELNQKSTPQGAKMRALSLCVYNPQKLADEHSNIYQALGNPHVLRLTGTMRRFDGINHVTKSSDENSLQLHWGAPAKTRKFTNQHTGVGISLSKRWFRAEDIKKIYSAPEELQGRGGAVRIVNKGNFDVTPIVTYWPPSPPGLPDECPEIDKIVDWVDWIISTLPARTMPILLMDSNGHLGPTKLGGKFEPPQGVGTFGAHNKLNYGGRALLELVERHHLGIVNTHTPNGSKATFYGTDGQTSRIEVTTCRELLKLT